MSEIHTYSLEWSLLLIFTRFILALVLQIASCLYFGLVLECDTHIVSTVNHHKINKATPEHRVKYPPHGMEDAIATVIDQCEMWTDS